MGEFRMNTGTVHTEGGKISNLSDDFGVSRRKIDEIVERILASDYTSNDAKSIATEIKSHNPMLNQIQQRLERHGNFGMVASKQTIRTQEDIISSVNNGNIN